ncbi:hypothetical protein niasHT_036874 [Heterodera trifolii]|uniref:Integrase catalytic domain-containing protein n=1 Tax=Heterodera trifolii TaxID=157864 RepID=A0ABD2IHC8_9BILA
MRRELADRPAKVELTKGLSVLLKRDGGVDDEDEVVYTQPRPPAPPPPPPPPASKHPRRPPSPPDHSSSDDSHPPRPPRPVRSQRTKKNHYSSLKHGRLNEWKQRHHDLQQPVVRDLLAEAAAAPLPESDDDNEQMLESGHLLPTPSQYYDHPPPPQPPRSIPKVELKRDKRPDHPPPPQPPRSIPKVELKRDQQPPKLKKADSPPPPPLPPHRTKREPKIELAPPPPPRNVSKREPKVELAPPPLPPRHFPKREPKLEVDPRPSTSKQAGGQCHTVSQKKEQKIEEKPLQQQQPPPPAVVVEEMPYVPPSRRGTKRTHPVNDDDNEVHIRKRVRQPRRVRVQYSPEPSPSTSAQTDEQQQQQRELFATPLNQLTMTQRIERLYFKCNHYADRMGVRGNTINTANGKPLAHSNLRMSIKSKPIGGAASAGSNFVFIDGFTKETITEQNHPDGTGNQEGISPEKMELINTTLDKMYNDPSSPAAFAGVTALWKEARKKIKHLRKEEVQRYLEGHRTYTLMRPRRVRFPRAKTIAAGFMTDVQVDLADFQALSRHNRGHRYLLVAVDVLSKRVFVVPLKNKRGEEMLEAFKELVEQMPMVPHRIFSDKGTEFKNKHVKEFFEEHEIEKHEPVHSSVKASVAERAIRNVKQRLYRYFAEKQTLNWVDTVQKIVDGINSAPSRVHGMRPIDVNFQNAQKVWKQMYGQQLPNISQRRAPRFRKNEFVRMSREKGHFEKGYLPNYGDEILEVDQVLKAVRPIRYKLRDDHGEKFRGTFYEQELARVRNDDKTSYRIEKVLRKRRKPDGSTDMLTLNKLNRMSSNSFFVFLPSNVTDYPDNQPNKFRVRLPKPLHFSGSWVCGLHSISYPYSWHSTIGTLDEQWIDIHFTNLHSVDEDRQRVIRVPVPQASHKKVEQLRDYLQATLKSQEKVRLKPLAHEEGYFDKPLVIGSPPHAKRLKRTTIQDLSSLQSPPRYEEPGQQEHQSHPVYNETEKPGEKEAKAAAISSNSHPPPEAPKVVTTPKQEAPKSATTPPPKEVTSTITVTKTTPAPAPIPSIKQASSVSKPSPSKKEAVPKPTPTPPPASKSAIPTPASSSKPQNTAKIPTPFVAKPPEPNATKKPAVPTTVSTTSISNLTSQIAPTPTTPKPPLPPILPSISTPSPPTKGPANDVKRSVEAPNKKESKRILDVDDRFFGGLPAGDEFPDDDDKESEWPYEPFKNIVDDVEIQYLEDFERFKVVLKNPVISHLSFSPQLGYVLGFENPQNVGDQEMAKYGCDLRGGFSSFAVYSKGLTENMIIGNSLSSLLRVVSVSGATPGDYNEKIYDSPIYARVLQREINEIEIELRTMDKVGSEALSTGQRVLERVGNEGVPFKEAFVNEGKKGIDTVLEKGGLPKQFGNGGRMDLFRIPPTNVSVSSAKVFELLPSNPLTDTPYHFKLHSSQNFIDLSKCYLQSEFRIRKENDHGQLVDLASDEVAPIQMIGQTFIRNIKMSINGREVFNSNSLMAYKTYFSHELSYSNTAKDSHLNAAGYYRDNGGTLETGDGRIARRNLFARSRTAQFIAKIDADLFNQPLYLINFCELDIEILPNDNDFVLITTPTVAQGVAAAPRYRFEVVSLKMYVKKVSLMDGLALDIARKLEVKPARYAVRKTLMKSMFISHGRFEFTANLFMDQIPRRITMGPFNFQPFNVREISIIANGRSFPQAPYDLDYPNWKYVRPFNDMNEAVGFANSLESNGISYEQFGKTHCIYVFNLTNSGDDQAALFDLIKNGTTAVSIKFNQAVPAGGIMLVVMGECDSLVMLDKNRSISTDITI